MKFIKMHGLGNDYVYVDMRGQRIDNPPALARVVSDRHTGIGSDGLILIHPSDLAHVRMEMYNADGSRGRMCGNGLRCVARYAVEQGLAPASDVKIETDAGIKRASCELVNGHVQSVRLDMGVPILTASDIPVDLPVEKVINYAMEISGRPYRITCVSMGNPHAVIYVDDLSAVLLDRVGPLFEHAPIFPERVNTHFVKVESPGHVTVRTWERGSGATRACGTGACAVAVAGALTDRTRRTVTTTLPGGDLHIEWSDADDHVYMTGPAVEVFRGEWLV